MSASESPSLPTPINPTRSIIHQHILISLNDTFFLYIYYLTDSYEDAHIRKGSE